MKQFLLNITCAITLASASIACAADTSGYVINSKANAKPAKPLMASSIADTKKIGYNATEITIYNDSDYFIYFSSSINNYVQPIAPYGFGFIMHPFFYDDIFVQIHDDQMYTFWSGVVCSKAQLAVESYWWGGHHVNVDLGYCDGYFFKKK